MATAKAYGAITIVDITDVGEFSVSLASSQPLNVLYDPNSTTQYNPDWGTEKNPLILTPTIYYSGKPVEPTDSGLNYIWYRKIGVNNKVNMAEAPEEGETVTNGTLTVSKNKFANKTVKMITYILELEYLEPNSGTTLHAASTITFSLVEMAPKLKDCVISGANVLKYNGDGTTQGASSVTLTVKLTNCSIVRWQYLNSNGTYVDYPTNTGINASNSSIALVVSGSENVFNGDIATIKVKTDDNDVFDIINIVKIRDGAAGNSTVSMVLSNEDQMVPCDSYGTPTHENALSTYYYTYVSVYEGGNKVNEEYNFESGGSLNVECDIKIKDGAVKVELTKITDDSGYFIINAKRKNSGTDGTILSKQFSLTKIKTGANGETPTIYTVTANTNVVVYDQNKKTYSPTEVTIKSYSQEEKTKTAYSGRFKIYPTLLDENGTTYMGEITTTSIDSNSYTYTIPDKASMIKYELYEAGGTQNLLDTQTISIVSNGKQGEKGDPGDPGKSAFNVVLGNYSDVIPVSSSYETLNDVTLSIPFSAYLGTTKVACSCSAPALNINGTSITPTVKAASASSDGNVTYTIKSGTFLSTTTSKVRSGNVTLSFTYTSDNGTGIAQTAVYSWSLSVAASNGTSPVLLTLYAPETGTVIHNGKNQKNENSIVLQGVVYSGTTVVSDSSVTWKWYKWITSAKGSDYKELNASTSSSYGFGGITDFSSSSLTIPESAINGSASFKLEAFYNSKTYTAYIMCEDKSDPLQVAMYSTVGSQIKNKQGVGVVYARVYRNGEEIDAIQEANFITSKTDMIAGNYYYYINTTNKTVQLVKATSATAATNQTENFSCTYTWDFRNSSNKKIDGSDTEDVMPTMSCNGAVQSNGTKNARFVYVDASIINNKITMGCEVEI